MHNPDRAVTDPDHQTLVETTHAELTKIRGQLEEMEAAVAELDTANDYLTGRSWYADALCALLTQSAQHLEQLQEADWDYDRAALITQAKNLLADDTGENLVTRLRTQVVAARACVQAADAVEQLLGDIYYGKTVPADPRVTWVTSGYTQARWIFTIALQDPTAGHLEDVDIEEQAWAEAVARQLADVLAGYRLDRPAHAQVRRAVLERLAGSYDLGVHPRQPAQDQGGVQAGGGA